MTATDVAPVSPLTAGTSAAITVDAPTITLTIGDPTAQFGTNLTPDGDPSDFPDAVTAFVDGAVPSSGACYAWHGAVTVSMRRGLRRGRERSRHEPAARHPPRLTDRIRLLYGWRARVRRHVRHGHPIRGVGHPAGPHRRTQPRHLARAGRAVDGPARQLCSPARPSASPPSPPLTTSPPTGTAAPRPGRTVGRAISPAARRGWLHSEEVATPGRATEGTDRGCLELSVRWCA